MPEPSQPRTLKRRIYEIIFEAETPAGRLFDALLLVAIVSSVVAIMLESVAGIRARAGGELRAAEWFFTVLFTVEYVVRLYAVEKPARYARSFFGLVDLLSIVPTSSPSSCRAPTTCW